MTYEDLFDPQSSMWEGVDGNGKKRKTTESKSYGSGVWVSEPQRIPIPQKTLDRISSAIVKRLNHPDPAIRAKAEMALRRFKEDKKNMPFGMDESQTGEWIKQYEEGILGADWGITKEEIAELGDDIRRKDVQRYKGGQIDEFGRIKTNTVVDPVIYRDEVVPDYIYKTVYDDKGLPAGHERIYQKGTPLGEYINKMSSALNSEDREGLPGDLISNPLARTYYDYLRNYANGSGQYKKGMQEFVTGAYTREPNESDRRFNLSRNRNDPQKAAERGRRYDGPTHYVIYKRHDKDGNYLGTFQEDLDYIPEIQNVPSHTDMFPIPGVPSSSEASWQRVLDLRSANGLFDHRGDRQPNPGELSKRTRINDIDVDKDGVIDDKWIEQIKKNAIGQQEYNKGVVYTDISSIDPVSGRIYHDPTLFQKNVEAQREIADTDETPTFKGVWNKIPGTNILELDMSHFSPVYDDDHNVLAYTDNVNNVSINPEEVRKFKYRKSSYANGGAIRVPKHLRDEYGRRLNRIPGWGDDDTDVYF